MVSFNGVKWHVQHLCPLGFFKHGYARCPLKWYRWPYTPKAAKEPYVR
jgi:hypothetical protein